MITQLPGQLTPIPAVRVARPPIPDDQKLVLSGMDFLVEAVQDRLTPALEAQIQAEFGPYLGKLQYPVLLGNRLIDLLCATCLADQPVNEARQLFGRYYVARYRETILGGLLRVMAPLVNLEWVVRGLPRNFAAATNYGTYWTAELGPHHWRLEFEDDPGYPDLILGILLAGAEIHRTPGLHVQYTILGPQHTSFDIVWPDGDSGARRVPPGTA